MKRTLLFISIADLVYIIFICYVSIVKFPQKDFEEFQKGKKIRLWKWYILFTLRIVLTLISILYFIGIILIAKYSKEKGIGGVHFHNATSLFLVSLAFGMVFTEIFYSIRIQIYS
jgi:hypothetical protein